MVISSLIRPLASGAALIGLAAYAVIMLRGPQGVAALVERHGEIRAIEEQNANLRRDIEQKRQRIDRLQHDPNAQEVEVRKRTKMQRPGETKWVTPEQPARSESPVP